MVHWGVGLKTEDGRLVSSIWYAGMQVSGKAAQGIGVGGWEIEVPGFRCQGYGE